MAVAAFHAAMRIPSHPSLRAPLLRRTLTLGPAIVPFNPSAAISASLSRPREAEHSRAEQALVRVVRDEIAGFLAQSPGQRGTVLLSQIGSLEQVQTALRATGQKSLLKLIRQSPDIQVSGGTTDFGGGPVFVGLTPVLSVVTGSPSFASSQPWVHSRSDAAALPRSEPSCLEASQAPRQKKQKQRKGGDRVVESNMQGKVESQRPVPMSPLQGHSAANAEGILQQVQPLQMSAQGQQYQRPAQPKGLTAELRQSPRSEVPNSTHQLEQLQLAVSVEPPPQLVQVQLQPIPLHPPVPPPPRQQMPSLEVKFAQPTRVPLKMTPSHSPQPAESNATPHTPPPVPTQHFVPAQMQQILRAPALSIAVAHIHQLSHPPALATAVAQSQSMPVAQVPELPMPSADAATFARIPQRSVPPAPAMAVADTVSPALAQTTVSLPSQLPMTPADSTTVAHTPQIPPQPAQAVAVADTLSKIPPLPLPPAQSIVNIHTPPPPPVSGAFRQRLPLPPDVQVVVRAPRVVLSAGPQAWLESFDRAVQHLDISVAPTEAKQATQSGLLEVLRGFVASLGGSLQVYGSCATGLRTEASDLDITWLQPQLDDGTETSRSSMIGQLRRLFHMASKGGDEAEVNHSSGNALADVCDALRGEVQQVRLICASSKSNAPPLLRLEAESGEVVCDVSLNNWDGLRNSALLRAVTGCSPSFKVLGRLVKLWARRRGIADRQRGKLSTYGLMLMLAGSMQQHGAMLSPPDVTKLCAQLLEAGNDVEAMEAVVREAPRLSHVAETGVSDGQLLLQFFEMYSDYGSFGNEGHSVNLATGLLTHEVRCPLTGIDIEAQLQRRQWRKWIFPEFTRALTLLSQQQQRLSAALEHQEEADAAEELTMVSLESICSPVPFDGYFGYMVPPPPPSPPPRCAEADGLGEDAMLCPQLPVMPDLPPLPSLLPL